LGQRAAMFLTGLAFGFNALTGLALVFRFAFTM
jgi:hypothetical protein